MDTVEQIKARMTPDVLAFAEKTFRLICCHRRTPDKMETVLFFQCVSLAYTHGRCDANDEIYAGFRQGGVK